MKRFLNFLATFSIVESIGRHPAIAGGMMLLGLGGGAGIAMLITPTITPQVSSIFGTSQNFGITNNVLQPNNGTAGPFSLPTSNTGAFVIYAEASIDPALGGNTGTVEWMLANNSEGLLLSGGQSGSPMFNLFRVFNGANGTEWWSAEGPTSVNQGASTSVGAGGYTTGFYPFTATGGGCAREPTGVWNSPSGAAPLPTAKIVDPGFLCNSTPTVNVATIPGDGAQQATGPSATPPQAATTCAVVNGEAVVTAHVAVAHGLNPGLTYTMQGFTPSGYNATYTALFGTAGTTLVGTTGAGICPAAVSGEGTALSGTGGTITLPPLTGGQTGITAKNGQHICLAFGEDGSDSPFPGGQFMTAVDEKGNALPGAPALVPWLNQGTQNFTGFLVTGSPSTATLNVTAMNPYTISAATYAAASGSTPAEVTFTTSTSPGFIAGSEFTVTGVSPSGYNQTYVAVAGTSGTTIVGNPLSGPVGTPQALSNPGAYSSGGSMVSVIMPNVQVLGSAAGGVIAPYGTSGGTGTGGVGSYALTSAQSSATFTGSIAGTTLTVTVAPGNPFPSLVVGSAISGSGVTAGTVITALAGGTGGTGNYTVNNSQAVSSETMTDAGTIGSSGSPVTIFAYPGFYYTAAPSSVPAGGVVTVSSHAGIDFINLFGGQSSSPFAFHGGWAGGLANVSMLYGTFPQQTGGAPSTTALASLCKKTTDVHAFAAANSLTVHSLYRLNDPGTWADSGVADMSGSIAGTALTITSSPAPATLPANTIISGAGVTGCPLTCPHIVSGSATSYMLNTSGGTLTARPLKAGAFNPATPIGSNGFNGFIDAPGGVPTLHVTSVGTVASFTGTLSSFFVGSISGTTLTVTFPPDAFSSNPGIGVGTTVSGPGVTAGTVVTALGTGRGLAGTYTVNNSQSVASENMLGGGVLPGFPGALTVSGASGIITAGEVVSDGGASITGSPLLITGGSGSLFNVNFNYYPAISNDTTMFATIATPVPGQYLINPSLSTPVKILSYGTLSNCPTTGFPMCGTYILSTGANGSVGSSGSPVAFTSTSISDGGAVAPGPALTIKDLGPGVTFPVSNFGTGTGTLFLSGTYDTATLGGTPSAIQAQISNTAGGPPIPGCTACAWTNLSSSVISGGNWSGQAINVPAAGGPLYVSVCAANGTPACSTNSGTAYATMPNYVKVGLVFDLWGQGNAGALTSGQAGFALNYFTGLWGLNTWGDSQSNYVLGPPVLSNYAPSQTIMFAGDRFGVNGASGPILSESVGAFEQNLTNAFGWPVTLNNETRDGIGIEPEVFGNIQQTQTVAVGDGTKTTWCSAAAFCANASVSGPLYFNGATMTGATLNGASITSGVLSLPATSGSASPSGVGLAQGALEPGMVLSGAGITGSPTLVNCLTGCTISAYPSSAGSFGAQTWQTSNLSLTVGAGTIRADLPSSGSPWASYAAQQVIGLPFMGKSGQGFGFQLIQAGTFKISVNGTVVCQDSQTFAYNNTGGNCAGAGISSAFVNYQTGDYSVTFSSPPVANAVITASWTNIISPEANLTTLNRPVGLDFFGDGTSQSGPISSLFNKTPSGDSGHIYSGCSTNGGFISSASIGYQFLAPGFTQMVSWLYDTRFPNTIPGVSAATPFISANQWRGEGALFNVPTQNGEQLSCDAWAVDVATKSTFSGTIASSVLTLSANSVGPMWEGEVISGTGATPGTYIVNLVSGAWGVSGSTYNLAGSPANIGTTAMHNAVYYQGPGPAIYGAPLNDIDMQATNGLAGTTGFSPHPFNGFAGGRRVGARWAAQIWGGLTSPSNASNPTVDRAKADSVGCDISALAAPCFDVGNTYAASATDTAISGNVLTFNGLTAHARPIVVGQAASCSGCSAGLFVTAVSNPPTQSTVAGAGQIGAANNGMTVTLNASPGVTGSGHAFTFGCAGTAGTGSNCVDIAFNINTTAGTYATAAALDTCGANNLNGTAANYNVPNGTCVGPGVGGIVRDFRIGTTQAMLSFAAGSFYEDGVDMFNNMTFNQSAAFTCNIVAAKVVQCVKGASYASGLPTSVGMWASGHTFIDYGEPSVDEGSRIAQVMGYAGGQSFPITNGGSGYTNGVHVVTGTGCGLTGGGVAPTFDVWVSGGAIVDVYPSATATNAAGVGIGTSCTIPLTTLGAGTGGVIPPIALAPLEGVGGIGTYNTDSNNTGVLLYDNSGEVGNPLNSFFTNGRGGYFEPGLPVQPFGGFQGAQVSG